MAKKLSDLERLNRYQYGKEFVSHAERYCKNDPGLSVVRNGGSHVQIRNDKGRATVPVHPAPLATGTRKAIVKMFVAMGLVGTMVVCVVFYFGALA